MIDFTIYSKSALLKYKKAFIIKLNSDHYINEDDIAFLKELNRRLSELIKYGN